MDGDLLSAAQQRRLDVLLQAHLPEFIAALSAGLSPVKGGGGGGGVARLSSEAVPTSPPCTAASPPPSVQRSFSAVDLHEPPPQEQPQLQQQGQPSRPWVAHARTASTGAAAATCWLDSCSSSDGGDDSLDASMGCPAPAASSSAAKQQRRQQHFLQWRHEQQQQAGHPMLWRPDATLRPPVGIPVGEGREEQEAAPSPAGSTGSCPGPAPAPASATGGNDGSSPSPQHSTSIRAATFLPRSGSMSTLMHALRGVLGAANTGGGGRQQLEVRVPACPDDLDVREFMACFSPDAAAASKQLSRCSSTASAASSAMLEQHTAAAGGVQLQEQASRPEDTSPDAAAATGDGALPHGPLHSGLQAVHGGADPGRLPLSPSPTKRSMLLHGPSRLSFRSSANESVDGAAAAAVASPHVNPLAHNSSLAALQQPLTQGLQQLREQQQQSDSAQGAAPRPAGSAEAPSEHLDHHQQQQQPHSPVRRPLFARMMGSKLQRSASDGHKQQQQQAAASDEPAEQPALKQQARQWLRRNGGGKQPKGGSMAGDGAGGVQAAAAGGSSEPEQAAHALAVAQQEAAMGASQAPSVHAGVLLRSSSSSNSRPQGSVDTETPPSLFVAGMAPRLPAAADPGATPPSPAVAPHSPACSSNSGGPAVVALADGMQRIASCLEDFLADARSRSVSPAARQQGGASIRRDQAGPRAVAGPDEAQPTTPSKPALQAAAAVAAWSPAATAAKARMLAAGSPSKQRQQEDDTRGCAAGRPAAGTDQNIWLHPGDLSHHRRQPASTAARRTSRPQQQQPDALSQQLPRGLQPPPGIVALSAGVQQQPSAVAAGGGHCSNSPEEQRVNTLLALASRAAGVDLLQQQPAAPAQMVAVSAGGEGASHRQHQAHAQQLWRPGSPGEGDRARAAAGTGVRACYGTHEVSLSSPAGSSSSSDSLGDLPAPAATGQHLLHTRHGSSGGKGGSSVRCLLVAGDVELKQPARVDTLHLLRPQELPSTAPQQQQHASSTATLWRAGASRQPGEATALSQPQQQPLAASGLGPNRLVRLPAHKPASAPLQPPVLLRPAPAPATAPWQQQQQPGSSSAGRSTTREQLVPWQALGWARQPTVQPGAVATASGDGSLADRATGRGNLTAGHAAARLLRSLAAQEDACDAQAAQDAHLQQQQQHETTGARAPWLPAAGQHQEEQRWAERPEQQRPDVVWSVPTSAHSSSAVDAPQQQQQRAPWQLPQQQQQQGAVAGPAGDASDLRSSCGAAGQRPAHRQQQQWHFKPRARSPVKRPHTACSSPSKKPEGSKRWALLQRLKTRGRAAGGSDAQPGVNGAALLAARQGQSEAAQRLIQQLQALMLPAGCAQGVAPAGGGDDGGFRPDLNAVAAMALHRSTPQQAAEQQQQQQEAAPASRRLSAAGAHSCSSSQRVLEQQASCHSAAAQTDTPPAAAPSKLRDAGVQVAGDGERQPREAAEELAHLILGAFERSGGCFAPDADTVVLSSSMWPDSAAAAGAATEPRSSWGADGLLPNPRAGAAFREVVDLHQPPGMDRAANPGCCFAACPHHMSSPELSAVGETSPLQQRSRRPTAAGGSGASAATGKRGPSTAGSNQRAPPGASGSRVGGRSSSAASASRGGGASAAAALSRQPSGRARRQAPKQQQPGGGGTQQLRSTNTWASQQTQQLDQLWQQWASQQQQQQQSSGTESQQGQADEAIMLAAAERAELEAAYARASAARAAAKRAAMQAAADRSQRFKAELQDLSMLLGDVSTLAAQLEADSGATAAAVQQFEAELEEELKEAQGRAGGSRVRWF